MTIRNKIKVEFFLEQGCSQDKDEVSVRWSTINFDIYSDLFVDMIQEAVAEWLDENRIAENVIHEVIFAHVMEHDGLSVHAEYFEPIYSETQCI